MAVITSTCGGSCRALARSASRCSHAEAVLLVDDDQAEVGELDALAEQRVGADDDAGLAGRDRSQRLRGGPCAPSDPVSSATRVAVGSRRRAARPGERPEQSRMDRACWAASTSVGASSAAWPPASTTCSIARSATHRLAGADLALQQPVHRVRPPGPRRSPPPPPAGPR